MEFVGRMFQILIESFESSAVFQFHESDHKGSTLAFDEGRQRRFDHQKMRACSTIDYKW